MKTITEWTRTRQIVWTIFNCVLFVLSVSILAYPSIASHSHVFQMLNYSQEPYLWSPLEQTVQYGLHQFDADLYTSSVFKGYPRLALNDAWNNIIDQPMILIDDLGVRALNETTVNAKSKNGKYYAMIETFHQLHCLFLIRKYIWRDHYDDEAAFQGTFEEVWEHVDHCIDLIRQVLICNADIGLIMFTDSTPQIMPKPRFSNMHKCRDFEAIVEWARAHDADM